MKSKSFIFLLILLILPMSGGYSVGSNTRIPDCMFKTVKLYGRVRIVNSFPDIRVQVVDSFPDLNVKIVNAFPDSCGKWQFVNSGENFKIQYVDSFPDVRIHFVDAFPGMP